MLEFDPYVLLIKKFDMRKIVTLITFIALFTLNVVPCFSQIRVVILGSSTAAGIGASSEANSWAGKYRAYLQGLNRNNEVINLANSGYTTYQILPNSVANRPPSDPERNITKALSLAPDVIIVNMPTNDANSLYSVQEVMNNYNTVKSIADGQNVPVYFTSTQPRTLFTGPGDPTTKRQLLIDIRNSTQSTYPNNYIDFWTGLAAADGSIRPEYDPGDGTHLNNAAHDLLYNRVKSLGSILNYNRNNPETEYVNLDFGNTVAGNAGWNVLANAQTGKVNNLINTAGGRSGIYAWVHDSFEADFSTGEGNVNGLPNGVSQDGFYGSGTNSGNPTGGITLGGLSPYKKYTLSFFSSITGNMDNRESRITVQGQTLSQQSINASANASQFLVFSNIKANSSGEISITVSAGGNNNSIGSLFYINALQATVLYDGPVINPGQSGKMLIDFGSPSVTTSGNWNNLTDPRAIDVRKDLLNSAGAFTGYKIYIHDAFNAVNTNGAANHPNYPATATSDSFYGNNVAFEGLTEPTGGVTFESLEGLKKYSFTFYSSRAAGDNRQTQFTVVGNTVQTVYLQTANNQTNTVTVADMQPDANGKITIGATYGPNNNNSNKFYYLGMLDVNYAPLGTLPVKLASFAGKLAQGGILLEWQTLAEDNNSHFEILRIENGSDLRLGIVDGKGHGNIASHYNYIDRNPLKGPNYYQLKQVDINGDTERSPVIVVNASMESAHTAWFSSDTDLLVRLNAGSSGIAQLRLTDISGRNIYEGTLRVQPGINENAIRLRSVPQGIYILNITIDGRTHAQKIMKR
jgi:lysophospholipase L1-like esterase